jgi:hypothetical protein
MPFRFITKSIHTYLIDYPVAIVLMVAPFLLKRGKSSPVALWLSVLTRVTAPLLPALTDHRTGLLRAIRYWLHLWWTRKGCGLYHLYHPPPLSIFFRASRLVLLGSRRCGFADDLGSPEVSAAQRANIDTRTAM